LFASFAVKALGLLYSRWFQSIWNVELAGENGTPVARFDAVETFVRSQKFPDSTIGSRYETGATAVLCDSGGMFGSCLGWSRRCNGHSSETNDRSSGSEICLRHMLSPNKIALAHQFEITLEFSVIL